MSLEDQFKRTLNEEKHASPEIVRMTERAMYEGKLSQVTNLAVTQQLEIKSLRDRVAELEGSKMKPNASVEVSAEVDSETAEHQRLVGMFMENQDTAGLLGYMEQRERVVAERAAKEASRDPLTLLPNRRSFTEDAGKRLIAVQEYDAYSQYLKAHPDEKDRRSDEPANPGEFSVIMLDLDHFKSINDTYGHAAGDEVLKQVANILRDKLRPTDEVARYGGEEFIVAFASNSPGARWVVAEKIRRAIALATITFEGKAMPVTASLGAAKWHPGERMVDVIQNADTALYEAKRSGRNRVVVDSLIEEQRADKEKGVVSGE